MNQSQRGLRESVDRRYLYRFWHQWEPGPRLVYLDVTPGRLARWDPDHVWHTREGRLRHGTEEPELVRAYEDCARAVGCTGYEVLYLFPVRHVLPRRLERIRDPFGPGWEEQLDRALAAAEEPLARVVAAWGWWGRIRGRAAELEPRVTAAANLWAFGVDGTGAPIELVHARARGGGELVLYRPKQAPGREGHG